MQVTHTEPPSTSPSRDRAGGIMSWVSFGSPLAARARRRELALLPTTSREGLEGVRRRRPLTCSTVV